MIYDFSAYMWNSPQFLSSENISGAEERDAREPQVLMQHEHTHGNDVGIAQVIYKAADVAIVTGINTVHLTVLHEDQHKECHEHISAQICFYCYKMLKVNKFPTVT